LYYIRVRNENAFAGYTGVRIEELIDRLKAEIGHPDVIRVRISESYIHAASERFVTNEPHLVAK
jgi:hypothetical protein